MQPAIAILVAALAASTTATPLIVGQSQICDRAPSGSGASPSPIGQPPAATADLCRQQCAGNTQCQCFVFGLPPNRDAPQCMLFNVPAAQIPPQVSELHVFDRACPGVPIQAPTPDQPRGAGTEGGQQQVRTGQQPGRQG